MTLETKKSVFVELGKFLKQFSESETIQKSDVLHNDLFFDDFQKLIALSQSHNGWYTPEQVYFAIQSWADALTEENISKWLSNYSFEEAQNDLEAHQEDQHSKTVALILA